MIKRSSSKHVYVRTVKPSTPFLPHTPPGPQKSLQQSSAVVHVSPMPAQVNATVLKLDTATCTTQNSNFTADVVKNWPMKAPTPTA